ncbi:invasion associated locus B family protein [Roseovarius sp. EL26]|uniref:invasion associated locus B family protein n=1 Tax=Roseovarius sp. EL26 TaxID=2126672 RepID=UPI000EA331D7|nr:invasion associated locus B family protein [Roseovarius sp. EL26]
MKNLRVTAILFCAAVLSHNAVLNAQETTETSNIQVFDDWRVACEPEQTCRMAQTVVQLPEKRLILQAKIFQGEAPTLLLTFPLGILLSTGWQYQVDGGNATLLPFEICNIDGCHVGVKLTPNLVKRLKRGNSLNIIFRDAGNAKVEPVISLTGFTKAYEALK